MKVSLFLLGIGIHAIFRKKKIPCAFFFVNLLDLNLINILLEKLPIKKTTFVIVLTLLRDYNPYTISLSNISILIGANK